MEQESEDTFDLLMKVTERIAKLRARSAAQEISKQYTKEQLYKRLKHAKYRGEKISQSWSKSLLVEAAISIEMEHLQKERDILDRRRGLWGTS